MQSPKCQQDDSMIEFGVLKNVGFNPIFYVKDTSLPICLIITRNDQKELGDHKKASELENLLLMYAWFHNLRLDGAKGVSLKRMAVPN